jgi:hypothetical protein
MKISVTLSANAGVAIDLEGKRIWVDALHRKKTPGFSTLTQDRIRQMMNCAAFQNPHWICYTHCHPDHYSAMLHRGAKALWPEAQSLIPQAYWKEVYRVLDGNLMLRFIRLPHEGQQYADVLHYGLNIWYKGHNVLIPGDCALCAQELVEGMEGIPVKLLLLDFPWVTKPKALRFLKEHFAGVPKIIYHLPFAEDDVNGYRIAAQRAADADPTVHLLMEPFQTIDIEI